MSSHDLVVLGDMVADLIVPIERLPLLPDRHGWADGLFVELGGAANVLVAARRTGLSTAALASVGADQYGVEVIELLAAEGVDVSHITRLGSTVLCIVLTDKLGQHVYLGIKEENQPVPFPPEWLPTIRNSRALFTNGYTLRDFPGHEALFTALERAREARVPVFFDFGPSVETLPRELSERAMATTDVLLLTEEEAGFLLPEQDREAAVRGLLERGPSMVVLKLGPEGCLVGTADELVYHAGFRVEVADTVGAGDSFAAAFIAGHLRGGSLRDCAALANAMGAVTTTQRGAGRRIPPREKLLAMLRDEPGALKLA